MLIIKNISRIPTVSLVIIGFFAGLFLPAAQSSCCCANSDNCCCCIPDDIEPVDVQLTSISDVCGCEMTEGESLEFTSLETQRYTKPQKKVEKAESLSCYRESLANFNSIIPANPDLIRNSGPPIFISNSSLLI